MELEVGYGLVRLVDTTKGGDLLDRISMIRRQIAIDLGIIVPPDPHPRQHAARRQRLRRSRSRARPSASGVTYPEQFLAMDNGATSGPIPGGTLTTEPAFGLPAYWITEPQRPQAEMLNYTVVEATAVLATHLTEVIKSHAYELLTRQEVKNLIDNLKARVPALIEEVIPTQVKPGELQKVMQNLLRERVPVRDLETIIETLGDYAVAHQGPGRADRICPQRPGPHDLQAVCGRSRPPLVPHARSGAGRADQRASGAQRARHDQHDAAADGAADRAADRRQR